MFDCFSVVQQTLIENAPTFLDEANDPEQLALGLESIRGFCQPVGEQSPPMFAPVVAKLTKALPRVEVLTFPGAGHIPHATDPEANVEAIIAFFESTGIRQEAKEHKHETDQTT